LEGEMLVPGLDLLGIAVTSGSACTSGSMQPSHVLSAMGRDSDSARSAIRFSFGMSNSEADIDRVVKGVEDVVGKARRHDRQ
jgi:cysteine desulfurase